MKLLLVLIFLPLLITAQSKYTKLDVKGAQKHRFQTIITNTTGDLKYMNNFVEYYASEEFKINQDQSLSVSCGKNCWQSVLLKKAFASFPERKLTFTYHFIQEDENILCGDCSVKKLEITGDYEYLVRLFTGYWTTTLDFQTVKDSEIASVRFLSDVATFERTSKGAKIVVVSAKDR